MTRIHAPELSPALAWINTSRPLSMKELRGQVVVLDFWTYCCVNCMHVVPVLRELEERHASDPLVVIGVHSAKFASEGDPERVAAAARRYGITHPVVVDREMQLWQRFGVRSWPTLVIVKPDGTVAAVAPGEPDAGVLEQFVAMQLREAAAAGTLASTPFAVPRGELVWVDTHRLERRIAAPGPLAFPGKVAVHADGRIAVSDSGHHRVLVLAPTGEVLHAIGTGARGFADGPFARALLDDPQGLCWDGGVLWICDARNHTLARADFLTGALTTMAGTGHMGSAPLGEPQPARVALRSPWDVVADDTKVYLALAGSHQLGVYDKVRQTIGVLAGTSREALVDGELRSACFAQPSGLALSGGTLYVADSEVSAVRAVDLARGEVTTLVGSGLFDFGYEDGELGEALLQHPLAVATPAPGRILVADTYNDALRELDLERGEARTFYRGEGDGALREPAGIAVAPSGEIVVADTNGHRLLRLSATGELLGAVVPSGLAAPSPPVAARPAARARRPTMGSVRWFELTPASSAPLRPGDARLRLTVAAPSGWKLNPDAPVRATLEVSRRSDLLVPERTEVTAAGGRAECALSVAAAVHPVDTRVDSELLVTVDAMICRDGDEAVCAPARGWYRVPVTLDRRGDAELTATLALAAPEL